MATAKTSKTVAAKSVEKKPAAKSKTVAKPAAKKVDAKKK